VKRNARKVSKQRMVKSVLTGVNVSTLKAGVLATGSVGKEAELQKEKDVQTGVVVLWALKAGVPLIRNARKDSQPRRGNNALTDADVSIQKGTVQATRNAGKEVELRTMKNVGIDVAVLWVLRDGVQVLRNAKKVSQPKREKNVLTDVGVNILRVGVQATSNAEQVIKPGTMKNAQTGAAAIWE